MEHRANGGSDENLNLTVSQLYIILSRAVLFVAFRYSTTSLLYAFYVLVMALIISTKGFGSYINCPQCFKLDSSSLKLEQSTWNKSEMTST